jgi:hypothetical protein
VLATLKEWLFSRGTIIMAPGDTDKLPIIHALWHGFPLCGFSRDVPKNWPGGNCWIAARDAEPSNITCEGCREKLKEMKYTG